MELENRDRSVDRKGKSESASDENPKKNAGKSSKGLKTVILILSLTLMIIALALGSFLLTKQVLIPRFHSRKVKKELVQESRSVKKKTNTQPGLFYPIKDLTVNTYGSMGRRFVVAEYALETSEKGVIDELKNRDHQIRDMLIKYLRNFSADQILEMKFQEKSRQELSILINKRLTTGQIDSLYYITLVVQ
jgi:flagellar basal body-associated protein FliL